MTNNDIQKANRAGAILRRIQRVICKNNPFKGNPDAEENDNSDQKVFVSTARKINPKDVTKEMANLLELLTELRGVVESIEDNRIKINLENKIDALENARRDIRDVNQDMVNDKNRTDDQVNEENGPPVLNIADMLVVEGGGARVFKDWT